MSAARKKGKWVGGCPVLGYDVDPGGGALVVNEEEAETVRSIFTLFEQHCSAVGTLAEIERRGWRLKSWTRKTGNFRQGGPFDNTSLRRLLTNVLYIGSIQHKGQAYPGEHAAILDRGLWDRVQAMMTHRATFARGKARNKHHALLNGLLHCDSCGTRTPQRLASQDVAGLEDSHFVGKRFVTGKRPGGLLVSRVHHSGAGQFHRHSAEGDLAAHLHGFAGAAGRRGDREFGGNGELVIARVGYGGLIGAAAHPFRRGEVGERVLFRGYNGKLNPWTRSAPPPNQAVFQEGRSDRI
ncbi:MAG TPA: recombinase family protein [Bryobacteraceae bacterium]|nr:recombinase family protein [Bryobacteraceae bacterium]